MAKTYCPNCDAVISMDNPREGTMTTCRECGVELEIISTDPFEVDFPLDYDEDWDDDYEEE
jgi:alpha-aminoadipate carrier protein LysW